MPRDPFKKGCEEFRSTRRPMLNPEMSRRQVLLSGLGLGLSLYATKAMTFDARPGDRAGAGGRRAERADPRQRLPARRLRPALHAHAAVAGRARSTTCAGRSARSRRRRSARAASGCTPSLSDGVNGGVRGMFEAGKIGFLPGIDYANPDLSHFNSRNFWETGIVSPLAGPGWLGRWLDVAGTPGQPAAGPDARRRAVAHPAHAERAGRIAEQPARRAAAASRGRGATARRRRPRRGGVWPTRRRPRGRARRRRRRPRASRARSPTASRPTRPGRRPGSARAADPVPGGQRPRGRSCRAPPRCWRCRSASASSPSRPTATTTPTTTSRASSRRRSRACRRRSPRSRPTSRCAASATVS